MAPKNKAARLEFCDAVREAVKRRGLTTAELMEALNLSQPTVSQFLSGKRFLSEDSMNRVAKFLRLEVPKEL